MAGLQEEQSRIVQISAIVCNSVISAIVCNSIISAIAWGTENPIGSTRSGVQIMIITMLPSLFYKDIILVSCQLFLDPFLTTGFLMENEFACQGPEWNGN